MQDVRVKKEQLLKTLKENRETHQADFDIAWEAFRQKAEANFANKLKAIKAANKGERIELHVNLVIPEDHTEDYDQAIEMLGWEIGDEITLQRHEFQQLVQDNWGWKDQFTATNLAYTGMASPSAIRR